MAPPGPGSPPGAPGQASRGNQGGELPTCTLQIPTRFDTDKSGRPTWTSARRASTADSARSNCKTRGTPAEGGEISSNSLCGRCLGGAALETTAHIFRPPVMLPTSAAYLSSGVPGTRQRHIVPETAADHLASRFHLTFKAGPYYRFTLLFTHKYSDALALALLLFEVMDFDQPPASCPISP